MDFPVLAVFAFLPFVVFGKGAPRPKLTIDREAHDTDNNKKLDGLELYTALEHDAKHEAEAHDGDIPSNEDLERDVEEIFSEHDQDRDGFLDFKEYLKVQKTHPDINREKSNKRREL